MSLLIFITLFATAAHPLGPSPELKAMLLRNLNRHGFEGDELEALDKGITTSNAAKDSERIQPSVSRREVPISPTHTEDSLPFDVVQNFFEDRESKQTERIHGLVSNSRATAPLSFGDSLNPLAAFTFPPPPIIPAIQLPTLAPLQTLPPLVTLPPLNFAEDITKNAIRPSVSPHLTATRVDGSHFVNHSAITPEQVQIWRKRFYKTFKNIKSQFAKNLVTDSLEDSNQVPSNQLHEFPVSSTSLPQFSLERSGYTAAQVKATPSRAHGNHQTAVSKSSALHEFAFPGPKIIPPIPRYSTDRSKGFEVTTRPSRIKLLAEYVPGLSTTARSVSVPRVKVQISNDFEEEADIPEQLETEEPCPAVGCSLGSHNPWLFQNDVSLDNTETCNSVRLKVLIENTIVAGDAEASKRAIQTRTENELGMFFNVICGTGFFSYIAHTDEFCLASVESMQCYVFSPVCSDSLGLSSGIMGRHHRLREIRAQAIRRQRKSFLNRN
ncbi:Ground-like domain protein [Aphelenchoides besseyi]|nr:Ground-like domain protein [Aphelenchoides besseyi]